MRALTSFIQEKSAASSVEYAVILGLIIIAAAVGIALFGGETANSLGNSQQQIEQATSGGS